MVIGKRLICLEADKYSAVDRCPLQAKYAPMATETRRVEARTAYSAQPNREWRSDRLRKGHFSKEAIFKIFADKFVSGKCRQLFFLFVFWR